MASLPRQADLLRMASAELADVPQGREANVRLIAENDRDRQRKLIKYNHLVANCLIFHNVQALTRALQQLARELAGGEKPTAVVAPCCPSQAAFATE